MFNKTKIKKYAFKLVPIACFCLLSAYALDYSLIKITGFILNPVNYEPITGISVARAEREEEIPMKLWVLKTVYEAGLNPTEADCIIQKESGWKDDAIGATKDYGLWQINIQHKGKISLRDMFDYKEATKFAINKRLHDGNWGAWVTWRQCKN